MIINITKYFKEPLYRNSIALMLNSGIGALFGLLFWIVAARTISSEDIGLATALISAAALITSLSKLGLDQGIIRYLPGSDKKNELYTTVLLLVIIISLVITVIFLIGINFFSPGLSFIRDEWLFLLIFILYIVITSIYSIQNVSFVAIRRADLSMIQNTILGVRIPTLLFLANFGVIGIFSSFAFAYMITITIGFIILYKYKISIINSFDFGPIKKTLKFSLGNYSASIFNMAPVTIIPIMILNTIGAEEGAYFYIAFSIATLLFMIPNAVSTSLFVEGSHNLPLKENVFKSIKLIFIFSIPAIIFIFFLGEKLLLIFGDEYSMKSLDILQLFAVSSIFSASISIFVSIKKIQKDVKIINYMNFLISALIIVIGYVGLLKYGLIGIGYAWLGANVIICVVVVGIIIYKEKWICEYTLFCK